MIEFKLPDVGEGIAEGEIVKWLVAEGAAVEEHEPVVEVMTDKATVEVPAPASGTLTKQLAAEGDLVPVGQVIFHLDEGSGSAPAPAPVPAHVPEPAPLQEPAPGPELAPVVPSPPAREGSAGTTIEFRLPDIGEGIAEGEIVRWLVEAGAAVEEYQAVVEVMTDKATVEVTAPASGTITELRVSAGDIVPVGKVLFHLAPSAAASGESAAAIAAAPAAATVAGAAGASGGVSTGVSTGAGATIGAGNGRSTKVLAVPSARRVARELGIDLALVTGTGRNGTIRRADVETFATSRAAVSAVAPPVAPPVAPAIAPAVAPAVAPAGPPAAAPSGEGETRTPFRGIRRKIAEAMVRSVTTAMHFTVVEEVDVTQLVALRAKAKALGAESGIKVTYMPFIMKAVCMGLEKFPMLNGHLDEQAGEIVNPHSVNLGIATDTLSGLIVPVLQGVQSKRLMQLAADLQDLATRTRDGKISHEELRGSTFTITNAGNIGGTLATPIINFPDIAILGVYRIVKRPGVVETPEGDRIEVRQYMNLSCSVDHRLADGADAARFLAHLRTLLEDPGLLAL